MKIRYTILAVMALMAAPKGFTALDESQKKELSKFLAIQPDKETLIGYLIDIDLDSFASADFLDIDNQDELYKAVRSYYNLPEEAPQSDVQGGSVLGKRPAASTDRNEHESSQKKQKPDPKSMPENLKNEIKKGLEEIELNDIMRYEDSVLLKQDIIILLNNILRGSIFYDYGHMGMDNLTKKADILNKVAEFFGIDYSARQPGSKDQGRSSFEEKKEEEDAQGRPFSRDLNSQRGYAYRQNSYGGYPQQQQQNNQVPVKKLINGVYLEDVVDLLKSSTTQDEFMKKMTDLFKANKNWTEEKADPKKTLLPEIDLDDLEKKLRQSPGKVEFLDLFLSDLKLEKDIILKGLTFQDLRKLWYNVNISSPDEAYRFLIEKALLSDRQAQNNGSPELKDIPMEIVKTFFKTHSKQDAINLLAATYAENAQDLKNTQADRDNYAQKVRDAYKTLGINEGSTLGDIRTAFKKLARKNHPDKGGNKEMFEKISDANNLLEQYLKQKK
jgi:hypothetical protein